MAAIDDWVKIEKSTARKPEVLQIAAALGVHPDHAFGLCVRFWMWVDDNLSRECRAMCATESVLDSIIGRDGFCSAMISVGWLEMTPTEIRIPHFERHLSKSSKKRAENSSRQRDCRAGVVDPSRNSRDNGATMSHESRDQEKSKIKSKNTKKETPTPLPENDTSEIVESIYLAYPRKTGKPAAMRAITKALKSIDGEALLQLTRNYAAVRKTEDPNFTPHPATWFNEQRYADDPSTWGRQPVVEQLKRPQILKPEEYHTWNPYGEAE